MPRVHDHWIHVELSGQLDHTDLELLENLAGYVVEVVSRPPEEGPPTIGVLMDVRASTSRGALIDALRLVKASTSVAIIEANVVTRPRWQRERASATTAIRLPSTLLAR